MHARMQRGWHSFNAATARHQVCHTCPPHQPRLPGGILSFFRSLVCLPRAAPLPQNGHEGKSSRSKETMYCAAVGHALLGALCLWRGFAEEEKWEKEVGL